MNQQNSRFMSREERDELLQTPDLIAKAYAFFQQSPPSVKQGNNLRAECSNSNCAATAPNQFSIEDTPPFRIRCFACDVRGDILELLLLLKDGTFRKARGQDFHLAADALRSVVQGENATPDEKTLTGQLNASETNGNSAPEQMDQDEKLVPNTPLIRSTVASAKNVLQLHDEGITDIANMSPAASKYFRDRPFLTPEMCAKWGVFYVPHNSKSTLRGKIAYHIENVRGELLAIAGRDPKYEEKLDIWKVRQNGAPPAKYRFPSEKFFRKGLELYGQQARRLEEPSYLEKIRETGLWLVESMNEVIELDAENQPAVAMMGTELTAHQIRKLTEFSTSTFAPFIMMNSKGLLKQQSGFIELAMKIPIKLNRKA